MPWHVCIRGGGRAVNASRRDRRTRSSRGHVDRQTGIEAHYAGGDRGYDTRGFVAALRELKVTPHVAQNHSGRRSAIDERTSRHEGYGVSQRKRKRVEEVFGWIKTIALQRKTRFCGLERVGWMFTFAAAAYNLVRMRNLQSPAS